CREMLEAIALVPRPTPTGLKLPAQTSLDVGALSAAATSAYLEDHGHELRSWDDVKDYSENYLKPLLFAELSGASSLERREDAVLADLARTIVADRGTAQRQLLRYFERFRK